MNTNYRKKETQDSFRNYEKRFRLPLPLEEELGFWVDRIGEADSTNSSVDNFRVLGQYALVYIEEGDGFYLSELAGREEVSAGDLLLIFPEVGTAYWPRRFWRSKWIVYNGSEARLWDRLGIPGREKTVLRIGGEKFGELYRDLKTHWEESEPGVILSRKAKLISFLLEASALQRGAPDTGIHSCIRDYRRRIVSHLETGGNLSRLSGEYGFSPQYIRKKFREIYGLSPKEFQISVRMARGKELLLQGYSIKESAALVGIADELYFMRLFKKTWGISAGKMRELDRGDLI